MILPVLCCLAAAAMLTGCNNKAAQKAALEEELARKQALADSLEAVEKAKEATAMEEIKNLPDEPVFSIVTNLGTIKVKLYKDPPKHRENFAKLALTGYYDSLLFHRVINGFMIQGGDPYTRDTSAAAVQKYGQGGPGYTIPAEFVPAHNHKKGALAAAGSQFYIVQDADACAQLDGAYTVFGETVAGLDVVDRIAQVATDAHDRPIKDVRIKEVRLEEE